MRECDDAGELAAAAVAGVGDVAIVTPALMGLTRSLVAALASAGVATVGVDADPAESARLRRLGVRDVVARGDVARDLRSVLTTSSCADSPATHEDLEPVAPTRGGPGTEDEPVFDTWLEADAATLAHVFGDTPGRVVTVWGPAGAPGRSTVAVALACLAAAQGVSTLLVDADPYGGAIAAHCGLFDEASGLVQAVREADAGTLDVTRLGRLVYEVGPDDADGKDGAVDGEDGAESGGGRLSVLTGLPTSRRWPQLRPVGVDAVLDVARDFADLVVVDTGFSIEDDEELSYDSVAPRRNAATLVSLRAADDVVVGQPGPVGSARLVEALDGLRELDLRATSPRVVLNRVRATALGPTAAAVARRELARHAPEVDPERVHVVPDAPSLVDAALRDGRPFTLVSPTSSVGRSLQAVLAGTVGPRPAWRPVS